MYISERYRSQIEKFFKKPLYVIYSREAEWKKRPGKWIW